MNACNKLNHDDVQRVKTYRITSFVAIVVAFGAWPQALEVFLGSNYTFHGVNAVRKTDDDYFGVGGWGRGKGG